MAGKNYSNLISTQEEGYQVLALTIIEEVCKDYRAALVTRDEQMIHSCESFLRGPRFHVYSQGGLDAEYLIEKIQEEIYGCKS